MLKAMMIRAALDCWNALDLEAAAGAVLPCCGSRAWAMELARRRPLEDERGLLAASDEIWRGLAEADWREAFDSHPRIGERTSQASASAQSLAWSTDEQSAAMAAEASEKVALQAANARYEERFGRIFLICARGLTTAEILVQLERRLANTPGAEIREAAAEQARITALRLRAWLRGE